MINTTYQHCDIPIYLQVLLAAQGRAGLSDGESLVERVQSKGIIPPHRFYKVTSEYFLFACPLALDLECRYRRARRVS